MGLACPRICYRVAMKTLFKLFIVLSFVIVPCTFANTCYQKKAVLENNEHELLKYKEMMDHGFKTRGHIEGIVVKETENRQGHFHFIVDLDEKLDTSDDQLELVYNQQYGEIATVLPGQKIRACGDFIVDQYSPTKAVLHWLHVNPNKKKNKHEDGFLLIDGTVFGLN